jgi:D-arabinose 1-dehydrogenase-like Zn-dependent alcohol dehydrogenase
MMAMVLEAFAAPLALREVPYPAAGADDLIVKTVACGVCATDLKVVSGESTSVRLPHVPGHEVAGIVEEAGADVVDFKIGDRVCCHFIVACRRCPSCRRGDTNLCLKMRDGKLAGRLGFEWPGGYAEYVRVPASVAVKVPAERVADLCIGADAIATAYRATAVRGAVSQNDVVVIIGAAGGLGIHALQIASVLGAETIAIDVSEERLDIARSFGADQCIRHDAWRDLLSTRADVVIDCAAVLGRSGDLIELLRPGGRFVAVAYSYEERLGVDYYSFVTTEKEVVGCRGATMDDLRAAINLVIAGDVEPVVTRRLPLVDANAALEHVASRGNVGRTVLDVAA